MAWAALGKGLMGAGRVVRTTGRGARMARRMFKRKGGKNSPGKPASQQTIDVEATEVRPSNSLVPVLPSPNTSPELRALGCCRHHGRSTHPAGVIVRVPVAPNVHDTYWIGAVVAPAVGLTNLRTATRSRSGEEEAGCGVSIVPKSDRLVHDA